MAVEPPKIDKLLAANLAKAKMATPEKPYFYALVLKGGGTSGKLLVDRLKIKEPQILNAKKLTGGSAVVTGVCYFDRKACKLVFETIKPPLPTWALLIKKLARDEAKLSIEVKFELAKRKLEEIKEPEADKEDEAAQAEEGAAEPRGALEKWNLQFEALKANLIAAGKAGKPWAKELWLKQSEAGAIYRQGKQDQAQKMFKEVKAAFDQKSSAAQPTGANGPQVPSSKPQAGSAPPTRPAGAGAATASKPAVTSAGDNTTAATPATAQVSLVGLQQSWEAALKQVRSDETKLVKAMVDRFKGHPGLPEAQRAAQRVTAALKPFNQQLSDVLGMALKSENPDDRRVWQNRASAVVGNYLTRLDADPVIAMLDSNPFMPVAIHKTLSTALKWLASKLS